MAKFKITFGIVFLLSIILISMCSCKDSVECGDNICHEDEQYCCSDCGCSANQVCDITTNECNSPQCGDKLCHPGEDCCYDCGCPDGEECRQNICKTKESEFKPPVCGNSICELGEDEYNCCDDCGCTIENMVCIKNVCSMEVAPVLTNLEAKTVLDKILEDKQILSEEIAEISYTDTIHKDIRVKQVCYTKKTEYVQGGCIYINKDSEVVDEIVYI